MISAGLLVLLGLIVWVITYGPPDLTGDAQNDMRGDTAFAELAALFDKPASPPARLPPDQPTPPR